MISLHTITTAEQLLKAGDIGRCELVRGELIMMSPSGYPHGRLTARLAMLIGIFVEKNKIGEALGAETGFVLERDPDTVRAPDVAFVRASRAKQAPARGFFHGAPDLAVEVLSPDDTASEVLSKTQEWLEAGTVAVWLVDPAKRTIAIHRSDEPVRVFGEDSEMIAGEPLPGFRMPVREVFN
jgi:Uma2 family endonuclease